MYFDENKYKRCINHLSALKTDIVISYFIVFAIIGSGVGISIMYYIKKGWEICAIGASIGAIIGLLIGLFSTWRVEMKIQEAYWRIDTLNELKKQSSIANKNTPFAKTVVAIENRTTPAEAKITNGEIKQ